MNSIGTTSTLASDARSLDRLKAQAGSDPKGAINEAAKQFEALFMQAVIKSMRAALPKGGIDGGNAGEQFTGMYDQQMAQAMAGRTGGLAEAIARQISGRVASSSRTAGMPPSEAKLPANSASAPKLSQSQSDFVEKLWRPAIAAQRETGIPAAFIIGQAALETGWGKAEIRRPDGSPANNLFGIKAGGNWQGDAVTARTTEYESGEAVKVSERFRAYTDQAHSVRDWAQLISRSTRYGAVMRAGQTVEGFAQGLQKAGYATDPNYATKLMRVINQTLALKGSPSAAEIAGSASGAIAGRLR